MPALLLAAGLDYSFAAGCERSPILFAYRGSLYVVPPGGKNVALIASGFTAPFEIHWAPGCDRYAFIDDGALWVGGQAVAPAKAVVPGTVTNYGWAPNGGAIVLDAQPGACGGAYFPGNAFNISGGRDVYLVGISKLSVRALSDDCGHSWRGWSPDSGQLLLGKKAATPPCAAKTPPGLAVNPPCAQEDLLIREVASGRAKLLITAEQLNHAELGESGLLAWDRTTGTLYLWSQLAWNGFGCVFAIDAASGKLLWRHPCQNAQDLGNDLIGTNDRVWVDAVQDMRWESTILNGRGQVVQKSPVGREDNWPTPWGFRLDIRGVRIGFADDSGRNEWEYNLPENFETSQSAWTPRREYCTVAWKEQLYPRELIMGLWLLDPARRVGSKVFEGTVPAPNETTSLRIMASGSSTQVGGGYTSRIIPPLVLGTWPHGAYPAYLHK